MCDATTGAWHSERDTGVIDVVGKFLQCNMRSYCRFCLATKRIGNLDVDGAAS